MLCAVCQKQSEDCEDQAEITNLPYHAAILQSDFKQRLLEAYQREGQQKYYAQQTAASCLGFMVISHKRRAGGCGKPGCTRAPECLGAAAPAFSFTFTGFEAAGAEAVAPAAEQPRRSTRRAQRSPAAANRPDPLAVRNQVISRDRPADSPDLMTRLRPIVRTRSRIHVVGCGKSALDGRFGVLGHHLSSVLAQGNMDRVNAADAFKQATANGGVADTDMFLIELDRTGLPSKCVRNLLSIYLISMAYSCNPHGESPYRSCRLTRAGQWLTAAIPMGRVPTAAVS